MLEVAELEVAYGDYQVIWGVSLRVAAGEIGVTKVVYDNIKNKPGVHATLLGERSLKNVDQPITLYRVDSDTHV